jgi:hypothetical protein
MEKELFSVGQIVNWKNPDSYDTSSMIKFFKFGQGPYTVLSVIDIPEDKCTCGGSFYDEAHEYLGCPYASMGSGRVRDSVGHPQRVSVSDANGNPLKSGEGDSNTFSGSYFTKC